MRGDDQNGQYKAQRKGQVITDMRSMVCTYSPLRRKPPRRDTDSVGVNGTMSYARFEGADCEFALFLRIYHDLE
jgi:hypothetical protein